MGVGVHELVIHDGNYRQHYHPYLNGECKGMGLIPRNYRTHPQGYVRGLNSYSALDMPLIPRSEWSARIKEMEATKSRLSDIRRREGPGGGHIPSLDQGDKGYCWMHSGAMCAILVRALMNQPYVRLSAYMGACLIKQYRDEGGWGAAGLEWLIEQGLPSVEFWPEKSMSRSNDTQAMRANARLHRVGENYMDLVPAVYDRDLTFDQMMTCLLCRVPVIADFNWWGHSVCLMDPVEIERGSFGSRGVNSWGDGYGDLGEFILQGDRAQMDGGCAPRLMLASAA
jgi:hypothetical protein